MNENKLQTIEETMLKMSAQLKELMDAVNITTQRQLEAQMREQAGSRISSQSGRSSAVRSVHSSGPGDPFQKRDSYSQWFKGEGKPGAK